MFRNNFLFLRPTLSRVGNKKSGVASSASASLPSPVSVAASTTVSVVNANDQQQQRKTPQRRRGASAAKKRRAASDAAHESALADVLRRDAQDQQSLLSGLSPSGSASNIFTDTSSNSNSSSNSVVRVNAYNHFVRHLAKADSMKTYSPRDFSKLCSILWSQLREQERERWRLHATQETVFAKFVEESSLAGSNSSSSSRKSVVASAAAVSSASQGRRRQQQQNIVKTAVRLENEQEDIDDILDDDQQQQQQHVLATSSSRRLFTSSQTTSTSSGEQHQQQQLNNKNKKQSSAISPSQCARSFFSENYHRVNHLPVSERAYALQVLFERSSSRFENDE